MTPYVFKNRKGKPFEAPKALAPLADTHTHLLLAKEASPIELIAQAEAAGVGLLGIPIDPTDHLIPQKTGEPQRAETWQEASRGAEVPQDALGRVWESWRRALPHAKVLEKTFFVYGVHPYGAESFSKEVQETLIKSLQSPYVKAVGEIGLDYTCAVDPNLQKDVFITQLKLAHEFSLPVELHIRDAKEDQDFKAHADALALLEKYGIPPQGADLHCFTGDTQMMQPFLDIGCMVAFGGAATFAKDDAIREAACVCPKERLLSETDSPFMAPVPLRGMECVPAMVCFVADCVARVREEAGVCCRQETYMALWENANRFFGA